jgi:hypothetical protein
VYTDFSEKAGLYTQFERATVAGFNRSLGAKSGAVTRKLNKNSGLTNPKNSDIIKSVSKINAPIENPIEKRDSAKGKPAAVAHFGFPLNKRQQRLLDRLPTYDSRVIVKKSDVNMKDLSTLTAETDVEFALFTKGSRRLVIRGNHRSVNVTPEIAQDLASQGYKWSGHTHPFVSGFTLIESEGDVEILKFFKQKKSIIYNSLGEWYIFRKD